MVVLEKESLKNYSSFKIGGMAKVIFPETVDELQQLILEMKKEKEKYLIFGGCSNVLFPDEEVDFTAIITTKMKNITSEENKIKAQCGASLNSVASAARDSGLTGLEFAYGIPGTVGGGLYMNAGAYGGQLSDVLRSCTVLSDNGKIKTLTKKEMNLGYRKSIFQEGRLFVLEAEFELTPSEDIQSIAELMMEYMERRKGSQPLDKPSAGSVFKRPKGEYAGALIEQCGLKGFRIGGAMVSEKHAGFIVNEDSATAKDVRKLIYTIQKTVREGFGILLEPEIRIL